MPDRVVTTPEEFGNLMTASAHSDYRAVGSQHRRGYTRGFAAPVPRPPWQRQYIRLAVTTDLSTIAVSTGLYELWGSATHRVLILTGLAVVVLTSVSLGLARAWDTAVLGQGSLEFTRLLRGFFGAAVTVGLVGLALELPLARPWAFGVLPIAALLAAGSRAALRIRLHRQRRDGHAMANVLAVGTEDAVGALIERTRSAPHHGWRITGVCTPTGGAGGQGDVRGVPVVGDLDAVATLVRQGGFDTVSVGQTPGWTPRRLQQLAWDLEGDRTDLVVDPGLMEIAGPRLHVANVDGLPLLRLTHPTFAGVPKVLKGAIDRVGALLLLLVIAPVLLGLVFAVRLDGGPAFFRQTRVGKGGREFTVLKFRSMVVDAEERLAELHSRNEGAGVLFKLKDDPRITSIGRVLRKYSLDELPQLFNVLSGSMSLVGPRPPLPSEVAGYERAAHRRLLVKPGITGLWQVSGRSDLSWEQTVRLDLRYVENWTLALDAQIMLKTVRAVVTGGGAY
jgi:exopolysaccharide biosynthesis polyprenyl glycosylphosphotransferase